MDFLSELEKLAKLIPEFENQRSQLQKGSYQQKLLIFLKNYMKKSVQTQCEQKQQCNQLNNEILRLSEQFQEKQNQLQQQQSTIEQLKKTFNIDSIDMIENQYNELKQNKEQLLSDAHIEIEQLNAQIISLNQNPVQNINQQQSNQPISRNISPQLFKEKHDITQSAEQVKQQTAQIDDEIITDLQMQLNRCAAINMMLQEEIKRCKQEFILFADQQESQKLKTDNSTQQNNIQKENNDGNQDQITKISQNELIENQQCEKQQLQNNNINENTVIITQPSNNTNQSKLFAQLKVDHLNRLKKFNELQIFNQQLLETVIQNQSSLNRAQSPILQQVRKYAPRSSSNARSDYTKSYNKQLDAYGQKQQVDQQQSELQVSSSHQQNDSHVTYNNQDNVQMQNLDMKTRALKQQVFQLQKYILDQQQIIQQYTSQQYKIEKYEELTGQLTAQNNKLLQQNRQIQQQQLVVKQLEGKISDYIEIIKLFEEKVHRSDSQLNNQRKSTKSLLEKQNNELRLKLSNSQTLIQQQEFKLQQSLFKQKQVVKRKDKKQSTSPMLKTQNSSCAQTQTSDLQQKECLCENQVAQSIFEEQQIEVPKIVQDANLSIEIPDNSQNELTTIKQQNNIKKYFLLLFILIPLLCGCLFTFFISQQKIVGGQQKCNLELLICKQELEYQKIDIKNLHALQEKTQFCEELTKKYVKLQDDKDNLQLELIQSKIRINQKNIQQILAVSGLVVCVVVIFQVIQKLIK